MDSCLQIMHLISEEIILVKYMYNWPLCQFIFSSKETCITVLEASKNKVLPPSCAKLWWGAETKFLVDAKKNSCKLLYTQT